MNDNSMDEGNDSLSYASDLSAPNSIKQRATATGADTCLPTATADCHTNGADKDGAAATTSTDAAAAAALAAADTADESDLDGGHRGYNVTAGHEPKGVSESLAVHQPAAECQQFVLDSGSARQTAPAGHPDSAPQRELRRVLVVPTTAPTDVTAGSTDSPQSCRAALIKESRKAGGRLFRWDTAYGKACREYELDKEYRRLSSKIAYYAPGVKSDRNHSDPAQHAEQVRLMQRFERDNPQYKRLGGAFVSPSVAKRARSAAESTGRPSTASAKYEGRTGAQKLRRGCCEAACVIVISDDSSSEDDLDLDSPQRTQPAAAKRAPSATACLTDPVTADRACRQAVAQPPDHQAVPQHPSCQAVEPSFLVTSQQAAFDTTSARSDPDISPSSAQQTAAAAAANQVKLSPAAASQVQRTPHHSTAVPLPSYPTRVSPDCAPAPLEQAGHGVKLFPAPSDTHAGPSLPEGAGSAPAAAPSGKVPGGRTPELAAVVVKTEGVLPGVANRTREHVAALHPSPLAAPVESGCCLPRAANRVPTSAAAPLTLTLDAAVHTDDVLLQGANRALVAVATATTPGTAANIKLEEVPMSPAREVPMDPARGVPMPSQSAVKCEAKAPKQSAVVPVPDRSASLAVEASAPAVGGAEFGRGSGAAKQPSVMAIASAVFQDALAAAMAATGQASCNGSPSGSSPHISSLWGRPAGGNQGRKADAPVLKVQAGGKEGRSAGSSKTQTEVAHTSRDAVVQPKVGATQPAAVTQGASAWQQTGNGMGVQTAAVGERLDGSSAAARTEAAAGADAHAGRLGDGMTWLTPSMTGCAHKQR